MRLHTSAIAFAATQLRVLAHQFTPGATYRDKWGRLFRCSWADEHNGRFDALGTPGLECELPHAVAGQFEAVPQ